MVTKVPYKVTKVPLKSYQSACTLPMCPTRWMVLFYDFLGAFWCGSRGIRSISLFLSIHSSSTFSSTEIFPRQKNAVVTHNSSSTCEVAKVTHHKKQLRLSKRCCISKRFRSFQLTNRHYTLSVQKNSFEER